MKKYLIILIFSLLSTTVLSQSKNCNMAQIQLDTYDFATSKLEMIQKGFSNLDALIQVSVDIKDKKVKKITYYLILPENSYSGVNKKEITVWEGLDKFVSEKVNSCLNESSDSDLQYTTMMVFRIPLSQENIQMAINEVNSREEMKK